MVLSNTKLKRKKREQASAIAALAPTPDRIAAPPSDALLNGDALAVESSKKKRRKSKVGVAKEGHAEDGVDVMQDDAISEESSAIAVPDAVAEDTVLPIEKEKNATKRRKSSLVPAGPLEINGEVELSRQLARDPSAEHPKTEEGNAGQTGVEFSGHVARLESNGASKEDSPAKGQTEESAKRKIRKKPRWPEINGKRVKPGTEASLGQTPSVVGEARSAPDNDAHQVEKPSGADAQAVSSVEVVQDSSRIVEGDEPWLEGGMKKKKKKLTDRRGKKVDDGSSAEGVVTESQDVIEDAPSQEEKVDPKKVMVGGMPYYVTEDDIHEFFQECGSISELDCMTFPDTGKFKGIAFITFRTEEAAKRALALDGADMGGRFLKIEVCKIKPKGPPKKEAYKDAPKKYEGCLSAYIGNLSWDISERELRNFFKGCKIDAVRFAVDKETDVFRGFGHIDFADDESLEAAMILDQTEILGRPIKIAYSVPKRSQKGGEVRGETEQPKRKNCYTCGEGGHMSYNCPKKPLL